MQPAGVERRLLEHLEEDSVRQGEDAARVALRTQQVIAHESGVADTVDPLAGSYAIEELTSEIERRAVDYLDKIDAIGGTLHAIESGYIQREIQNAAYEYQRALEANDAIVVGVNRFQNEGDAHVKTLRVDPAVEKDQIDRLRSLRERRDAIACETSLVQLEEAAGGDENVVPRILYNPEMKSPVRPPELSAPPGGKTVSEYCPSARPVKT